MEAKTNYTIVGLAVIILIAGLLTSMLWLSVGFGQKKYTIYAVYMNETVSGLSKESAVKFNGVPIGLVYDIQLNHEDPQQVRILLQIEEGTPITESTTATIISQGITGTSFVGLTAKSPDLIPLKKLPNQPYPVIPSTPSLFNQLDQLLKEVSKNINGVTLEIKRIFDKKNARHIQRILANMDNVTSTFSNHQEAISDTLKNTNILMQNLSKASVQFPDLSIDLKQSLRHIEQTMDSGKIAIDKITQQALPPAVTMLQRLDNAAVNLDKIMQQMRQNPSVIIRGNIPAKPGPGE